MKLPFSIFFISLTVFIYLTSILPIAARTKPSYQIQDSQRAIIIFNLAQQVTWLNDIGKQFKIVILDNDEQLTNKIKLLAKKRDLKGRKTKIVKFKSIENLDNIQLLYINKKSNFNIDKILNQIRGKHILLITENYDYQSSMVNITLSNNQFQYEINTGLLEKEKFTYLPSLKKYAINSSEVWRALYETKKSLNEAVIENKQQKEIIKNKIKEIEYDKEKINLNRRVIEKLSIENSLKDKKYEEKIILEKKLAQTIKKNAEVINSQKEKIKISANEIAVQQRYLNNQKKQVSAQKIILDSQIKKINYQKNTNLILLALSTLLFFSLLFIYKGYVTKNKLNKKLEEKNIAIYKQSKILETKNSELEQFAYIASHDLQEPLNTITSFISLIKEDHEKHFNEIAKESMGYIVDASSRMKKLINSILDYSRLGRVKNYTIVNTQKLLLEIKADLKTVIDKKNAEITLNNLPKIKGTHTELRLLFQNLISNGIKFCKPGTKPKIFIDCDLITNDMNTKVWKFSVKDNGIGIAKKHEKRIFNIFQRLHSKDNYEGTGIGLAHCKKIVESHGGDIWISSEINKGTTFYFTIPFS
ncbi:YfiR/HmsC family protein [Aquimarina agarilytica]|uniref:YfiR/HmsC family protein n=1 Tax=Aquimarina agarilytica TaxID=1087449 RepID=UPI00028880B8|nr:YfiR/HmsC family protein [Aquimarina agarilytica]